MKVLTSDVHQFARAASVIHDAEVKVVLGGNVVFAHEGVLYVGDHTFEGMANTPYSYSAAMGMLTQELSSVIYGTDRTFAALPQMIVDAVAPDHPFDPLFVAEECVYYVLRMANGLRMSEHNWHEREEIDDREDVENATRWLSTRANQFPLWRKFMSAMSVLARMKHRVVNSTGKVHFANMIEANAVDANSRYGHAMYGGSSFRGGSWAVSGVDLPIAAMCPDVINSERLSDYCGGGCAAYLSQRDEAFKNNLFDRDFDRLRQAMAQVAFVIRKMEVKSRAKRWVFGTGYKYRSVRANRELAQLCVDLFEAVLPFVAPEDESNGGSRKQGEGEGGGASGSGADQMPQPGDGVVHEASKEDAELPDYENQKPGVKKTEARREYAMDVGWYNKCLLAFEEVARLLMETVDSMKITDHKPYGCKVNRRKLPQCMTSQQIFTVREHNEGEQLRVAFCLDDSGSMEAVFGQACAVTKAIGDQLVFAGAEARVWVFSSETSEKRLDELEQYYAHGGSTWGAIAADQAVRFLCEDGVPGRRVLMFVSDGCLADAALTSSCINQAINDGVEVIFIGVGGVNTEQLLRSWKVEPHSVSVVTGNKPEDLAYAMVEGIAEKGYAYKGGV